MELENHFTTIMKAVSFFLIFLAGFLFSACNSTDEPVLNPVTIHPKTMNLVEADNLFGFQMFHELQQDLEPQENIMISPISMANALAMALNGAHGSTYEQMVDALNLNGLNLEEINQTYQALMADLVNLDEEVVLSIANSIWYADFMPVKPDFIQNNGQYYQAEVSPLNFDDPASVDIINQWVSDNTKGKIESIVEALSPYDRMLLINATYFKGKWKYQFDEADSYESNFYPDPQTTVPATFMSMNADVERLSNEWVDGLKLPYGKEGYSMYLLMPQYEKTMEELLSSLNQENWNTWMTEYQVINDVAIHIPRFSFEYESDLNQALRALGMEDAFIEQLADFSGITDYEQLFITNVKHKSFIEVNEQGTEAAAVTSITFGTTSVNPITQFIANKPFLFAIVEEQTGAIIFMGQLNNPEV